MLRVASSGRAVRAAVGRHGAAATSASPLTNGTSLSTTTRTTTCRPSQRRSNHVMASVGNAKTTTQLTSPFQIPQQTIHRRDLHLSPREVDHLQLHQAGRLAQYRLARGCKLNHPEAVALIAMQMMEEIRDGNHSVAELMELGGTLLGQEQLMPGVAKLIYSVQIEATFPDGKQKNIMIRVMLIDLLHERMVRFMLTVLLACICFYFQVPNC